MEQEIKSVGRPLNPVVGDSMSSTLFVLSDVRRGDSKAQQQLYEKYVRRLIRLAAIRIADQFRAKLDPEDIVQSVFRSFFIRHEKGDLHFESWNDVWAFLARVTIRKCNRAQGRFLTEKRDLNRESAPRICAAEGHFFGLASREPGPQELAIIDEILDSLMNGLTELQQEIVRMKLLGYSNLEISERLGKSERTIYRSLSAMRDQMDLVEAADKSRTQKSKT